MVEKKPEEKKVEVVGKADAKADAKATAVAVEKPKAEVKVVPEATAVATAKAGAEVRWEHAGHRALAPGVKQPQAHALLHECHYCTHA